MTASKKNTLQLIPPKINLQTKPIRGANVGVPLHALIPYPGAIFRMAQVVIDPILAGTVEQGDEVELWATFDSLPQKNHWTTNLPRSIDAPMLLDTTTIKDVNAEIALFISEGQFYYGVVTRLYYIIRRASSNIGESPALTFIFNLIRPGLKDRLTVPGGHSELKLLLPDSIKNGVGADFVSAQVRVQYPYCRAYDLITLICNGETLDVEVQPTQAPVPPSHGSETPLNIEITVDKAFLMRAKRNDNKLDFLFTVHDQLLNSADPDAPRSPPQTVDEDLDGLLFLKAILREIEGDTSDEPDIIDLKKLAKNDLTVAILTADSRIAVDDEIKGIYTATRTGFPDIVEPLNGTVEKGDFEPKKTCILKVPNHKVIAGSTVTVTYEVKRNGGLLGKSQTAKAQVIGTSLELKPPSVLQANGTTLAPLDALSKLTIAVPQGNTLPSDLLSVRWTAKPGTHAEGSIITTPKLISEIGLNNDLPPQLMAYSLGGVVSVSYVITRDGEELPSETLTLTVQDLPQSALIAPRLKEADADGEGAELKLANLTPEGKMWCPGFPLIAEGQFVWLLFKGTNANGKPYQEYIWAPTSAFVNAQWVKEGFFEAFAPYGDLIGLQDGSSLTIEMFIAFGKSEELALAKRFLVRSYRVSAVDESLSVDTSPVVLSGRNYTVDLAAVRWELTGNDLPGTVVTREATGGKPPYTYTSSAPEIVSVDTTGRIRSVWNGMAKIIVSDTSGKSLEIPVQSSNVQQILSGGDNLSDAAAMAWMQRVGGTPFPPEPRDDLSLFNLKFRVLGGPGSVYQYYPGYYRPSDDRRFWTYSSWNSNSGSMTPLIAANINGRPFTCSALCIAKADG
ncbi:hypothetical protein [Pseudomonas fluorescens]|uniref:hypothetical protein n=1 Tax=Pseudomonas fluorescens TaxID=294 RepID=UPI0006899DFF|nr:hypothetical protein [Pseudomonas fluorescens]